jgi:hypothetical protein
MHFTFLFVATVALAQVSPANRTFGLLENRRTEFDFIPYTAQQKAQVVQTVLNLMQVYVNRESKILNYGAERPDIDPIPKVQSLARRAASLSDRDFHYGMLDIFTPLRDFHTLYLMPGPHSCISNFKAIDFTITEDKGREQIVVKEFSQFDDVKRLSPEHTKISIGDELLTIDNQPIQDYIRSRLFLSGGANEFGGKKAVLNRMSVRPGAVDKVPTENANVYRFRKYPTGEEYTVTLPWVTGSRNECLPAARRVAQAVRNGTPLERIPIVSETSTETARQDIFENPRTKVKKQAFAGDIAAVDVIKVDDIVDYAIYKPESKNLGVIFLKSFVPTDRNVGRIVSLISNLLTNELRNTRAVVFDIRDNGGGIITLAETIPQLFKEGIQPLQSRALNNAINREIFRSPAYGRDNWTTAIEATPARNTYTNLVQFTPNSAANSLRPVYTKPVAIFNNAECYSSCDLFSAMFQDNQVGPVFGEDGRSGAGGANVVELGTFFNVVAPSRFPAFPFVNRLPERARPNCSWMETICACPPKRRENYRRRWCCF